MKASGVVRADAASRTLRYLQSSNSARQEVAAGQPKQDSGRTAPWRGDAHRCGDSPAARPQLSSRCVSDHGASDGDTSRPGLGTPSHHARRELLRGCFFRLCGCYGCHSVLSKGLRIGKESPCSGGFRRINGSAFLEIFGSLAVLAEINCVLSVSTVVNSLRSSFLHTLASG